MADLPKYLHPLRMAEQGVVLRGQLNLTLFTRLTELLADNVGQVNIDLQCGIDHERIPFITGTLDTILHLECQRCLKTMAYPLQVKVSLSPILNEAAGNKLPIRYEPLLLEEDKFLLVTLAEDELLLALPIAPKHAEACEAVR